MSMECFLLVRNTGGNCIVTEFTFVEVMEVNAASDGTAQIFQELLVR